jgi:hypothetical protein
LVFFILNSTYRSEILTLPIRKEMTMATNAKNNTSRLLSFHFIPHGQYLMELAERRSATLTIVLQRILVNLPVFHDKMNRFDSFFTRL